MDPLSLHADASRPALVHGAVLPWQASPSAGVERRLLERVGGEVALATSIVRYAPHSHFAPHEHGAGEEFLVLEGVFSDEHGDYPPMTYVRNPPGSVHSPRSTRGCTIFVKLRQMAATDRQRVVVSTEPEMSRRQVLHRAASLSVELHHLPPDGTLELDARHGGEELFVCEGSAAAQGIDLQRWSWWRRPAHEGSGVLTSSTGATVWLKRGHLDRVAG